MQVTRQVIPISQRKKIKNVDKQALSPEATPWLKAAQWRFSPFQSIEPDAKAF